MVGGSVVVVTVKFADSLQPNQPGVRQVVVVNVVVTTGWVLLVDPSRQPHQPGVLQVAVLVKVVGSAVLVFVVVVVSDPLLSKNFQL